MVDTTDGRPLLASYPSSPPSSPTIRHSYTRRPRRRWLKPLILLSLPPLFLFIYVLAHPLIPSLPPLPHIRIETGEAIASTPSSSDPDFDLDPSSAPATVVISPDSCVCGATDRGKALCNVYQKAGLRASRIVQSSGARLRRVLAHARDGHDLRVGVLGGSGKP